MDYPKCPICKYSINFKKIPTKDRYIRAFDTIIKCPQCGVTLKPSNDYKRWIHFGVGTIFLSLILIICGPLKLSLSTSLLLMGISISFYGHRKLQYEVFDLQN